MGRDAIETRTVKFLKEKVLWQRPVAERYREMAFSWGGPPPRPGQFFTLSLPESCFPLLRRPFAFSHYQKGEGRLYYEVRGRGTQLLEQRRKGATLEIMGPLGNSFSDFSLQGVPILVGGGIGVGPLFFLAQSLYESQTPFSLIIGGKSRPEIPLPGEECPYPYSVCTEDGSQGTKGTPIDLLQTKGFSSPNQLYYACGPLAMLSALHFWTTDHGCRCVVSMEQIMGCALGACMGCAIPAKGGESYFRVCTEGPVFLSEDLQWT